MSNRVRAATWILVIAFLGAGCSTTKLQASCKCTAACPTALANSPSDITTTSSEAVEESGWTVPGLGKTWDWFSAAIGWLLGGP